MDYNAEDADIIAADIKHRRDTDYHELPEALREAQKEADTIWLRKMTAWFQQAIRQMKAQPQIRDSDPEAYVAWLQRQRALPYIELARDLNEQSRRGWQ